MPPLRTSMSSTKPIKTERTHEENQERAYIAASRRSDRRLEARVDSARRASEIHKRRTGRSLRVTEQDVVNEVVYEEEDDDLPMQYQRLTAHLQTQNADFTRRFQDYLVNHVAMRQAVGEAAVDELQMNNQQFHTSPQYFKPGFIQLPQQQPVYRGSMMPPQMFKAVSWGPRSNYAIPARSDNGSSTPPSHSKYGTSFPPPCLSLKRPSKSQELQRPAIQASPISVDCDQQLKAGMHPFTVTLPMESQQTLGDYSSLDSNMSTISNQYNYTYNPNGTPRNKVQPSMNSLNQKLMGPPLDVAFGGCDTGSFMALPQFTFIEPRYTLLKPYCGYGMGFDSGYGEAMYKASFEGSSNIRPQDLELSSRFDFQERLIPRDHSLAYEDR
ncbi:hypothetical protein LTR22_027493 [Elasticomyces elasticus]|nr:hypothetical protein LTR22_027493 [Elasticomyces elasticus]KAK5734878.1 hypothetical protein LTS12_026607 [Elasticomyces elasticus]